MKIYNKKGFFTGLFWLVFGVAFLCTMVYRGMELLDIVACVGNFSLAIYYIGRSFSRNMSDADQDERTKLIVQKTRATAYSWTKGICIFLGILYIAVFSWKKDTLYLGMFACFAMIVIGMLIIEGIIELYYERKL